MGNADQKPTPGKKRSCDPTGRCMLCKTWPDEEDIIDCIICKTPWHLTCLIAVRESLALEDIGMGCPDCDDNNNPTKEELAVVVDEATVTGGASSSSGDTIVAQIMAIQADGSLTEEEKARKRQELLSGRVAGPEKENGGKNKGKGKEKMVEGKCDALEVSDESFNCSICLKMLDRPVSTPCGHNFCLKCFQSSTRRQRNSTCPLCRNPIPAAMASQPRINLMLVFAIRKAKMLSSNASDMASRVYEYVRNQDRPDKAYTTERAKKSGKANAASGRIFVTVPTDHFGPILAENDPERNRGVLVGDTWADRLECRQWGAHFPPIKGIAGQQDHGAQSVILSGGYEDDEDHGEWFLYTGSGGRDLSGNKRTNKDQSFDQEFKSGNESLRLSCKNGYPIRVIRSFKDKHSSYAPEKGLRYDGIYRVEKCWLNVGVQGFKVCRYLFVRCDNDPAPWTSDVHGDCPRPLPVIEELKKASNVTERKESPSWDYDEADGCWKWIKPPPISKQKENTGNSVGRKRSRIIVKQAQSAAAKKRLQKQYGCPICKEVLEMPVTTPCGHNFCKSCLEGVFAGHSLVRERNAGGRPLRSKRNVLKCPSCPSDLSEYLNNLKVNIELKNLIAKQIGENENSAEEPRENGTACAQEDLSGSSDIHEENSEEADVDGG
ncbi:PREDICTED: E3 ubiquitin-protein ligase ORTHRUS 2 isoform X1 [Theobroma cacao]|uniref:RING-type E3 ubiquitin transferase n=2 Tax=Theobroma cacao TaxID=3641 RepID=A0AB32VCS1_THECC|nr:PREDICTED: E3 ubiquitin-protein ligase ORTHRUS 2 isoform X1 [Theobroma cacao]EOY22658.1 Zinc finger (C3HC4-type RING finger) family protein, putative isoform 1 [Theobroma cacao]